MSALKSKLTINCLDDQLLIVNMVRLSLSNFEPDNSNAAVFRAVLVQLFERLDPIIDRNWYANRSKATFQFNEVESKALFYLLEMFQSGSKVNPYVDSLVREWYQSLGKQHSQIFKPKYTN
jgi:hypothetical protein